MAASAIPAMAPPADQSKRTRSPKPPPPPPATISPPQVSCRSTDDVSSRRHARHWQLAIGNWQLFSPRQLPHRIPKYLAVLVHIVLLRLRRHQRHIMKRRQQNP